MTKTYCDKCRAEVPFPLHDAGLVVGEFHATAHVDFFVHKYGEKFPDLCFDCFWAILVEAFSPEARRKREAEDIPF